MKFNPVILNQGVIIFEIPYKDGVSNG